MFNVPPKFYELCRLCLSSDGSKLPIFDDEGLQRNFADKILTCLSIAVSIQTKPENLHYIFRFDDNNVHRIANITYPATKSNENLPFSRTRLFTVLSFFSHFLLSFISFAFSSFLSFVRCRRRRRRLIENRRNIWGARGSLLALGYPCVRSQALAHNLFHISLPLTRSCSKSYTLGE